MHFSIVAILISMIQSCFVTIVWIRHRKQKETLPFIGIVFSLMGMLIGNELRRSTQFPETMRVVAHISNPVFLFLMTFALFLFFSALYEPKWLKKKGLVWGMAVFHILVIVCIGMDGSVRGGYFFGKLQFVAGAYSSTSLGSIPWLFPASATLAMLPSFYLICRTLFREPSKRKSLIVVLLVFGIITFLSNLTSSLFPQVPRMYMLAFTQVATIVSLSVLVLGGRVFEARTVGIELALAHMADGIAILDLDKKVIFTNAAMEKQLGLREGEHVLQSRDERFSWPEEALLLGPRRSEFNLESTDSRFIELASGGIRDEKEKHCGYLMLARDVTEKVHQELTLKEKEAAEETLLMEKQVAESANKAKSAFLANMSHELRTPLNAIIGYSELIEEEAIELKEEGLIEDLHKIRGSGKHLLELINEILDLSKIETGKMELYLEEFNLAKDLVFPVVDTLTPAFDKSENAFELSVDPRLGDMKGDLVKVRQILMNLLSNANKFTERGVLSLEAIREKHDEGDWIVINVRDTGIGMSKEQVDLIFEPFIQADLSTTRRFGGTGLGLAITKEFCRLMGGDVEVQSELHLGSEFVVRLPAVVEPLKEETEDTLEG